MLISDVSTVYVCKTWIQMLMCTGTQVVFMYSGLIKPPVMVLVTVRGLNCTQHLYIIPYWCSAVTDIDIV
jgi:hypothetical protein